MAKDQKTKTAVVTGAATGIGKACADLLASRGYTIARLDVEPGEGISVCDVADESAIEKVFGELDRIDILVNSAGIAVRKNALEITREDWDRVIAVNQTGTFLCARAAARRMKEGGGGAIVNLASIMGFSGGLFPNPAYQASKGAVVNLTRALALEFAPLGIRANAVAPSFVRSNLTAPIFANPELLKKVMEHTPLGVLPEVEDIAQAVAFLAGPEARCITGVTLPVDSGYLAR
jgi:NAD(P)-dependent dehydrogenase (short-subunit alcohol dehydrogenase family)